MANIKQIRPKDEARIYKVMDKLDPTGQNTEFYKKKFANANKVLNIFKYSDYENRLIIARDS